MPTERDDIQRSILPIPHRERRVVVNTYDAKDPNTKFAPIEPVRPPKGAPNVLIVLLDDVGFGASSAFGGPVSMPTAERLASRGLEYTRFHTTALCSPTRQALLTGRNHHSVGMGCITEMATSAPGYTSLRPNSKAPLAEILKLNGYATAQFGKCHEVPLWQTSPTGPFDQWPTGGGGFEYFYGFVGGDADQLLPEGTHQVRAEFAYDGGVGKGGNLALYYDGHEVGRGRIAQTQPLAFSAEETTDVGYESGSLVTTDYPAHNGHFSGKIHWVQIDTGKDNFSHLIKPEERLRVVMTRQ